ncbi:MAG: hypothetical protein E7459_00910 [Ruminococcaceae bacterium]|nr:hypothetical protein [Oscillospiraceae bacterium]
MKQYTRKQFLSMILALVMIVTSLVTPAMAAKETPQIQGGSVMTVNDPEQGTVLVSQEMKEANSEEVTILVGVAENTVFMQTGDVQLAAAGFDTQMAAYAKAEADIEKVLTENIEVETRYSLLFNGFSFTGEKWMIDAINQIDGLVAFEDVVFELEAGKPTEEIDLTPSMSNSTINITAVDAWNMGYSGEGMVVAIIDSGIRKTHEAFSVEPKEAKIDKAYLENVFNQYGDKMHGGDIGLVNSMYYNAKLPFCWDYVENDADPQHTATDHGTHVAGIAAGNNGKDFKGVAPEAQIVPMGVFEANGGASFTTLMAAMEDCVYLGVDAINMSLGVAAFFSAYESIDAYMDDLYAALEDAGVSVVVAAGNDNNASVWNNYSLMYDRAGRNGMWPMMNLDNGVVGAPATFPASLAVASVQNGGSIFGATKMYYGGSSYDVEAYPNDELTNMSGNYELVWVGTATTDKMAELKAQGISLEGKIALAARNDCLYDEKVSNVAKEGAVACIIMNSIPNNTYKPEFEAVIPCGLMDNGTGEALLNTMNGTKGVYYGELPLGLSGEVNFSKTVNYNLLTTSYFSSLGTTAGLEIKPEIAAPGGGITSSIGFGANNSYAAWDGTSMATPHVAGGMLLVKQALREQYPEATAAEINELAHNYLLSTAHGIDYEAVRKQGAGMMDLASAIKSRVYATVDGGRPKLELDDSKSGSFDMVFELHNDGATDKTYSVSFHALTMAVQDLEFTGYRENFGYNEEAYRTYNQKYHYFLSNDKPTWVKVTQGYMRDVTDQCTLTGDKTITVKAGETKQVMMSLSCSDDLLQWIEWECPAGNYLEGFIRLTEIKTPAPDAGGRSLTPSAASEPFVNLSIPFLGFIGDWDYVPMFDDGFWWQIPYGVSNLAQSTEAQGTYVGYGRKDQGLGLNRYGSMKGQTYVADRNAISPNGDGILDAVDTLQFAVMRNPRNMKVYLEDADGNLIETLFDQTYWFRKEFYTAGLNGGTSYSAMEINYDWSQLEENQTVYLVMEAWLDDHEEYDPEDNFNGRMKFPITIDTTAPQIIPEFYAPGDAISMGLNVVDKNYVAYYAVYADAECTDVLYEKTFFAQNRNNWECSFNNEWTNTDHRTEYYVFAADYAGNETLVKCTYEGQMIGTVTEVDRSASPAATTGRTIIGRQMVNYNSGNYEYAFVEMNTISGSKKTPLTEVTYSNPEYDAGWGWDFTAAAVQYDGTVYINSFRNLAILNPETYDVTFVAKINNENADYDLSVRNIMSHPETGEIYGFVYITDIESEANTGEFYCKIDTKTGHAEPIWKITNDLAEQAEIWNWAYCYVDADTIAIFAHNGYVWLVNEADGTLIREIDMDMFAPNGEQQVGINGTGGNMLFDKTTNKLHIYSNWMWLGYNHYNVGGYITIDLDNDEVEYHGLGAGVGYTTYGLYFADEVVAKSWYSVIALIDAIAETETLEDMKAAIDAARAAYEALSETEKGYINNYQTLLDAETQYLVLLATVHADGAAAAAAEAKEAAEKAAACAEEAATLAEGFPAAAEAAEKVAAAAEKVAAAAEAAEAAAAEAATAAEAADIEAAAAAEQEALAALEEALAALAETEAALEETRAIAGDTSLQEAKDEAKAKLEEIAKETEGFADHQIRDLEEAVKAAEEAIENATTITEIENILAELEEQVALIAASCPAKEFTDVNLNDWYHDGVDYVLANGLMEGMGDGIFAPNANLTRGQLVTILYRMAGEPSVKGMRQPFTDVLAGQWYSDAIVWAYNEGIVNGMSATVFGTNAKITREQIATILYRYVGAEEETENALADYADAGKVSDWAVEAMNWAVANGLINGMSETTLVPQGNATRAQIATILMRYFAN